VLPLFVTVVFASGCLNVNLRNEHEVKKVMLRNKLLFTVRACS